MKSPVTRGLGRVKPHVELVNGRWYAYDIERVYHPHPMAGAEYMNRVGKSDRSWLEALQNWMVCPPWRFPT